MRIVVCLLFLNWLEIKGYDDVKASLDHDVMLGVIEPVPVGEPVTWFHRMVGYLFQKEWTIETHNRFSGSQCSCNKGTRQTQSPFHQTKSVLRGQKKTALNGYHSVPIRKEDRHLTTFIHV